jgi:hypothetical protein
MQKTTATAALIAMVCTIPPLFGAEEKRIDLASVITKADAQTALGEAVKDPQSRNDEGADGYYSRCNYYGENPGRSLVLRVRQAAPGQLEPAKQLDELTAANPKFKAIAGLGEKAAILSEGPEKGSSHALMLYVVKGNALITVGISGLGDEKNATEKAKILARKILKNL